MVAIALQAGISLAWLLRRQLGDGIRRDRRGQLVFDFRKQGRIAVYGGGRRIDEPPHRLSLVRGKQELLGAVGVVDVAGPMQDVEDLADLGDGAEQRRDRTGARSLPDVTCGAALSASTARPRAP